MRLLFYLIKMDFLKIEFHHILKRGEHFSVKLTFDYEFSL